MAAPVHGTAGAGDPPPPNANATADTQQIRRLSLTSLSQHVNTLFLGTNAELGHTPIPSRSRLLFAQVGAVLDRATLCSKFQECKPKLTEALELARADNDQEMVACCLTGLGFLHAHINEIACGLDYYRDALAHWNKIHPEEATARLAALRSDIQRLEILVQHSAGAGASSTRGGGSGHRSGHRHSSGRKSSGSSSSSGGRERRSSRAAAAAAAATAPAAPEEQQQQQQPPPPPSSS